MASGGQQQQDRPGSLRRQNSNWADDLRSRDEAAGEEEAAAARSGEGSAATEISNLMAMFTNVESQVESLEAAMDPRRWGGALAASYGRQVYETMGPMLREAQATSATMAQRVEALSREMGRDAAVPREVLDRSSELVARVDRAWLAHRARCPPQELERRLSREPSFSVASAAAATAAAADASAAAGSVSTDTPLRRTSSVSPSGTTSAAAAAPAPGALLPPTPPRVQTDATTGVRNHQQAVSDSSSAACRPLTRTLTLEDVVKETTERDLDHHRGIHEEEQEGRGGAEHDVGGGGDCGGGGGGGGGEGDEDVAMAEARLTESDRGITGGTADSKDEGGGADGPESSHNPGRSQDLASLTEIEEHPDDGKGAPFQTNSGDEDGSAVASLASAGRNGGVKVYSFGRGDLGALLHGDEADHFAGEGPVVLKDHWSVMQVSTSLFHTMAVTASGDLIGCGQNDEGQVRPDLPASTTPFLPRPSLVEPLLSHRVTQVACGLYHTACVTASGVAITWGGNESGQLGHSAEVTRTARPKAVQIAGAGQAWSSSRRATRVACGDLFTLILSSRAELFSCGVGECVGGDGTDRRQAALVQSLAGFPTVWMACGNSHSVVIGAGGEALAFGLNTHGQLGVGDLSQGEGPAVLLPRPILGNFSKPVAISLPPTSTTSPPPAPTTANTTTSKPDLSSNTATSSAPDAESVVTSAAAASAPGLSDPRGSGTSRGSAAGGVVSPPTFLVRRAACGQSHTVLVSTAGDAWVCGRNRSGQLGIDPEEVAESSMPVRVPLLLGGDGGGSGTQSSGGEATAVQAAAGRAHTLLLMSNGRVVGFGSDEFGTLGRTAAGTAFSSSESLESSENASSSLAEATTISTGSDSNGNNEMEVDGGGGGVSAGAPPPPSYHWKPAVIESLSGQWVASVCAGGEQTFALVLGEGSGSSSAEAVSERDPSASASAAEIAGAGKGGSATTAETPTTAMVPPLPSQKGDAGPSAPAATTVAVSPPPDGGKEAGGGSAGTSSGWGGAGGGRIVRQGSEAMFLRRSFSLPSGLRMRTAGEFVQLIRSAEEARAAAGGSGVQTEGQGQGKGGAQEAAVVEAVRQTFASPSVLSGCFNADPPVVRISNDHNNGLRSVGAGTTDDPAATGRGKKLAIPRVDSEGLDTVLQGLVGLGPRVAQALWSAIEEGMASVRAGQQPPSSSTSSSVTIAPSLEAGGVSFLLKYWQVSSFARDSPDASKDEAMDSICKTVLGLKGHARWWLMRSAKEDYPSALFSSRLVKPLVAHLAVWVKKEWGRQTPVFPTAALLLKWLHSINELESVAKVPYKDFFSEAISEISLDALLLDLLRWKAATPVERKSRFFLCEYAFLISTGTKKALLQAEAEMEQMKAARTGGAQFVPGIGVVINPFLVLQVNRSHLLHETLAQVSRIPDSALRKKLKVVFRGEEGVDEGGVAKEFFQLLTVQLFDQSFGMFVPAGKEGRSLWFNKDCVWADEEYGLVGLLVGLAVYSGVILDVPLPLVVFKKVLGEQLALEDLGDIDPDLLQGLQRLREYDGGDDEDIFGLDFRITWDDLGMERSRDLLEGGADIPVTADNKEQYVELYAQFLLMGAVSRQFDHFKQGFLRVMSGASSISLLRAEELEVLVTGTPELDFKQLAEATQYEGGYGKDHPTMLAFWAAVEDMPPEEQKRLLMFVTGSKKAPLGGLGKLSFKIQRAGPDTDHLPTSHTCFNVLMLPEYSDKEKLTRLLKIAITECEGFGLK